MTLPGAQGILTTAQAPGAGIYVQAVIYAQATFEASAQYAMPVLPKGHVHFNAHAKYGDRPPKHVTFRVSARYEMVAGTHGVADVTIPVTARFGANVVPQGTATFPVTVSYSFAGVEVQPPPVTPAPINVAVTRAATI